MRPDRRLPGVADLLGPRASDVLRPAVAAAGGRLLGARPTQVRYEPGRRLVVRYGADVAWADGTERVETFGALLQRHDPPPGLAVVEGDGGARVGVWRYPHDPFLPGLPHAACPAGARGVLAHLGVDVGTVRVAPLVYRPGSRAVLRVVSDRATVYLKVVRPGGVAALRLRHDALGRRVRVPRCLGWSDGLGLLALEPLPGRTLARALVDDDVAAPAAADVLALLDRVGHAAVPATGVGLHEAVATHAALLRAVVPAAADLVAASAAYAVGLGVAHDRTVHGDFYEAQVLVAGGGVTGLLDVDGARPGAAHEDPATLIAHLEALARVRPAAAGRIRAYRRDVEALAARRVDAEALRRAVVGALLGLATTPFRRQEPGWRARTQDWVEVAASWTRAEVSA